MLISMYLMVNFVIKPVSFYRDVSTKLANLSCKTPFGFYDILGNGDVSACCCTWLPEIVGNVLTDSADEIINNPTRLKIQEGMKQSKFDYCNDQCPELNLILTSGVKRNHWIVPSNELETRLKQSTLVHIGLNYDQSCNLQCPSCRNEFIYWNPKDNTYESNRIGTIHEKTKALVNRLLEIHHDQLVTIGITSSGDAFASVFYWDYLCELANNPIPENLRINLKTNGLLMTKERWMEIEPLLKHISYLDVSIDAATEETYSKVRKNGIFKKLIKNLEDLDELVFNKKFPNLIHWQNNFIVQEDNFKELKQFVEYETSYKSKHEINITCIAQWGHMTDEQFKSMAVWQVDHPHHQELLDILKDPIFRHPWLWLGNLASMLPKQENI